MDYKKRLLARFLRKYWNWENNSSGGPMKKEKLDVAEFNEIRILTTGYTRPGAQSAESEVNRLLKEGWVLIESYTTCYSNTPPLSSQQEVHFVLGKKEKKEVVHHDQAVNALKA